MNLANSSTCLPHRLQYSVGAITNTKHVDGVALFYPAWINRLEQANSVALLELNSFISSLSPILEVSSPIIKLMQILKVLKTPKELGIDHEMKGKLVNLTTGTLELDPVYEGRKTIEEIFEETLICKQ